MKREEIPATTIKIMQNDVRKRKKEEKNENIEFMLFLYCSLPF